MRLQLEAMRVQQRIGRVNSQNMTPDQLAEAYDKLINNNMDEAEQLGNSYKSTIFWLSVLVPSFRDNSIFRHISRRLRYFRSMSGSDL